MILKKFLAVVLIFSFSGCGLISTEGKVDAASTLPLVEGIFAAGNALADDAVKAGTMTELDERFWRNDLDALLTIFQEAVPK